MALFQVSFTTPGESVPNIVGREGVIAAVDNSNYSTNTEPGHALSDFSQYKRVQLTLPDTSKYIQGTSVVAVKDLLIPAPSVEVLPISFDYSGFGDYVYSLLIESVPTWNASASYLLVDGSVVYRLGKFYQVLANTLNHAPESNPTKWVEITTLPARYALEITWSITYDTEVSWIEAVRKAAETLNVNDLKLTKTNPYYMKASRLNLILNAVGVETGARNWVKVNQLINYAKTL